MPNKIFIIHRSEVIRKGLKTMLNDFESREIVTCSTMDKFLEDYENKVTNEPILVGAKVANRIKHLKIIVIDAINPVSKNTLQVSIHTTSKELKEKLNRLESDLPEQKEKTEDYNSLTERETDVLRLVAYGNSNKEIADKLFISVHTVISHRKNITDKLSIKSISGLTVYAILNNLIDSDNIDISELI